MTARQEKWLANPVGEDCGELLLEAARRASAVGAAIRDLEGIERALRDIDELLRGFDERLRVDEPLILGWVWKLLDILRAQKVCFSAIRDYAAHGGASRGSCIYTDASGDCAPGLEALFRFVPDDGRHSAEIQETVLGADGRVTSEFRPVHPLPEGGGFFENVWKRYRADRNVW